MWSQLFESDLEKNQRKCKDVINDLNNTNQSKLQIVLMDQFAFHNQNGIKHTELQEMKLVYVYLHHGNQFIHLPEQIQRFLRTKLLTTTGILNSSQSYLTHTIHLVSLQLTYSLYVSLRVSKGDDQKQELSYVLHREWKLHEDTLSKPEEKQMKSGKTKMSSEFKDQKPHKRFLEEPKFSSYLQSSPDQKISEMKDFKFIASCSTLPSRVNNKCFQDSVKVLCDIPWISNVIINYPQYCTRLKKSYPSPPEWMSSNSKIVVHECDDYGPLTKMLPLLDLYSAKSQVAVFLFHDDVSYTKKWINDLLDSYVNQDKKTAVGRFGSGNKNSPFEYNRFNHQITDQEVLSLNSKYGVIYPLSIFPNDVKSALEFVEKYKDNGSMQFDDLLYASWSNNSETRLISIPTTKLEAIAWEKLQAGVEYELSQQADKEGLSSYTDGLSNKMSAFHLAQKMMQNGDFPIPWTEIGTVIGAIVFAIFLIIFLAIVFRPE